MVKDGEDCHGLRTTNLRHVSLTFQSVTQFLFIFPIVPHHLLSLQSHSTSIQGQSMTSPRDEGLLLMQSTNQSASEPAYHPGLKRARWESAGSESPVESGRDRCCTRTCSPIALELFFFGGQMITEPTYNRNVNFKNNVSRSFKFRSEPYFKTNDASENLKRRIFLHR